MFLSWSRFLSLFCCTLGLLSLVASVTGAEISGKSLTFEKQWQAAYGGVGQPGHRVVRDTGAWEALWRSVHANRSPRPAVPKIDFTKSMVIALFLGQKPSGGYGVAIESVHVVNGDIQVTVRRLSPPPGAPVTMALTSPYHIVVVARHDGQVKLLDAKPRVPEPGVAGPKNIRVIVVLEKTADLDSVVDDLKKAGLDVKRVLRAVRMVIGEVAPQKERVLDKVKGVKFVERDQPVGAPR